MITYQTKTGRFLVVCCSPQVDVKDYPHLNLPPVCPLQPAHGSVFCDGHADIASSKDLPVTKGQLSKFRCLITSEQIAEALSSPGKEKITAISPESPIKSLSVVRHSVFIELADLMAAMDRSAAETLSFEETLDFRCNKNLGTRKSDQMSNGMAESSTFKNFGSTHSDWQQTVLGTGPDLEGSVATEFQRNVPMAAVEKILPLKSPRSRGYLLISRPCGHIVKAVPIYK
jgi:hypothetical protein